MNGDDAATLPAERRSGATYWRTIALLTLLVALGHFNRIGISVAGTEHIISKSDVSAGESSGISPSEMGVVYSSFLLCYTLAMLPAGWLIDIYGPRFALGLFCFGSALFVALTGFAGHFWSGSALWLGLIGVRSLMGIVNAPLHPAAANVVFERVPARARSLCNGLVTFGACAGIVSTYHLFGGLMDRIGWPNAFFVTSMITLLIGAVWIASTGAMHAVRRNSHPQLFTERLKAVGQMFFNRSIFAITISYAALGYFQYLYFYWIQEYFKSVEQEGVDVSRTYTTLIMMAMGLGMVCGGWLTDLASQIPSRRWGRIIVPFAGLILSGAVFEAGLVSGISSVMLGAFVVSAGLLGACEGGFWTAVVELGGKNGGAAAGLMNMGGNAGGTLSPALTPVLSAYFASRFGDQVGWKLSLALAGVVAMVGAIFWLMIDFPERDEAEISLETIA
ncbi:MAG: MFS transporter [Planctomycetaceae bacterium]